MWLAVVYGVLILALTAQEPPRNKNDTSPAAAPAKEGLSLAPAKVDVKPVARDEEIRLRLQSVLDATDWFTAPEVRVEEGVVFLEGRVASDEPDVVSTQAEGGLQSEAGVLDEQARHAQLLQEGENLLPKSPNSSSPGKPLQKTPAEID